MTNVRWNFRLGPLHITSPFGAISAAGGALALLCCCGGAIGAVAGEDDPPARPAVNASAFATTTAAPASPRQATPSATRTTVAKPAPTPKRTTSAPKPSPTRKPPPAPKTDPRFDTCKAANASGYGPYVEGEDPEYDWYQDRDGDGIVCER